MEFQGRAFYNLLRFNSLESFSSKHYETWQTDDYRSLSEETIFSRLNDYGCDLDIESFMHLAANFDSPEALSEYLIPDEFDTEQVDKVYLCLFELWRRYKKDCRSLSIFSDELDHWMQSYDGQKEDIDDIIYSYIFELQNFLDEEVDQGQDPKVVFDLISSYFAHDIENFIYDFVYDVIEKESITVASEIIDAFLPYVKRETWFEYLKLKVFSLQDLEQFPSLIHRFSEKVIEQKDVELLIEVLDLMIDTSQIDLFLSTAKNAISLLTNYGSAQEYLIVIKEFYDSIEDHQKAFQVSKLLQTYQKKEATKKIFKDDPILKDINRLLD